jgi:Flp pilus assembly protein TadG
MAAMTAILFASLMAFAGLGIDFGYWYTAKRSMQATADAAVMTAALSYISGNTSTSSGYVLDGKDAAAQNGWVNGQSGVAVAVNKPPTLGINTGNDNAIEVVITKNYSSIFTGGITAPIRVHAVAVYSTSGGNGGCVLALSTSSSAITISGNGVLNAQNCGVDSDGSVAFNGTGGKSCPSGPCLEAKTLTVGASTGPSQCPNGTNCKINGGTGTVMTNTIVSDPYSGRSFTTPPTTPSTCSNVTTGKSYAAGTYCGPTISSGTYSFASDTFFKGAVSISSANAKVTFGSSSTTCPSNSPSVVYFDGGLTISGGTVTFCPGIYYIEGGTFSVSGQSTVTGTHVTFIITKSPSGTTYATTSVTGNNSTSVTLSAPTSSTTITLPSGGTATEQTAGIVLFEDPNAPSSTTFTVGGSGTINLTGAVYAPNGSVTVAGNGISGNAACTQVVAATITITGNGAFGSACTGTGVVNFGNGTDSASMVE